jgi:hypothetical protein
VRDIVFPLTHEAHLRDLIHPLTRGQIAHYHDLGLRRRVLSLPVLVCAACLARSGMRARPRRATSAPGRTSWPPCRPLALLLCDRGVINCGLVAQLILARITVVIRARSTPAWQVVRCTAPATLGTPWSGAVAARTECSPWEGPITIPQLSSPDRPPPIGSSLRKGEHQLPGETTPTSLTPFRPPCYCISEDCCWG